MFKTSLKLLEEEKSHVFREQSFPLHFGGSVTGIFSDLAVVAFLPPK